MQFRNFKMVGYVVYGRGSFNQLDEIIAPHRKAGAGRTFMQAWRRAQHLERAQVRALGQQPGIGLAQQAGNQLPYVECEKTDAQREQCAKVGIAVFPTWVMGNERRVGVQSLQELATWSGYKGAASFSGGKPGRRGS